MDEGYPWEVKHRSERVDEMSAYAREQEADQECAISAGSTEEGVGHQEMGRLK